MKLMEKYCGRGFDAPWSTRSILHFTDKEDWSAVFNWLVQYTSDGPDMVSTGQRVRIVALGKVEAVRVGDSRPKKQKT